MSTETQAKTFHERLDRLEALIIDVHWMVIGHWQQQYDHEVAATSFSRVVQGQCSSSEVAASVPSPSALDHGLEASKENVSSLPSRSLLRRKRAAKSRHRLWQQAQGLQTSDRNRVVEPMAAEKLNSVAATTAEQSSGSNGISQEQFDMPISEATALSSPDAPHEHERQALHVDSDRSFSTAEVLSLIQQYSAAAVASALAAAEKQVSDRLEKTAERVDTVDHMSESNAKKMTSLAQSFRNDGVLITETPRASDELFRSCTLPDGSLDPCRALQLVMGEAVSDQSSFRCRS